MSTAIADYGNIGQPKNSHLMERGLNLNVASLFFLCDAVVIAKPKWGTPNHNSRYFDIKECLWSKDGLKLSGGFLLGDTENLYDNNQRSWDLWKKADKESKGFYFGAPGITLPGHYLLFLRSSVATLELRKQWKLGDHDLYKAMNGNQGCVIVKRLPIPKNIPLKRSPQKIEWLYRYSSKRSAKMFGVADINEIVQFVRHYWKGDLRNTKLWKGKVGEKFRKDAVIFALDRSYPIYSPPHEDEKDELLSE